MLLNINKFENEGVKAMIDVKEDAVLITREACDYLRISRPTYAKYLRTGRIKATKAGRGWRVLKSELERFLKGNNGNGVIPKFPPRRQYWKSDPGMELNSQEIYKVESGEKDQG